MNKVCVSIKGEFKSAFNYGSMIEFSASSGSTTATWRSDAYGSIQPNSELLEKGEHDIEACSFLAPDFQEIEAGVSQLLLLRDRLLHFILECQVVPYLLMSLA
jgi:hypothetical protein